MTKNKKRKVGLIGTDSLRGREIKNALSRKKFPLHILEFFDPDVEEEYSKLTEFRGEPKVIRCPTPRLLEGMDLVFLAADAKTNVKYGRLAADLGYLAIDLGETFNSDANVPLIVAGVNDHSGRNQEASVIANPNPVTVFLSHLGHSLLLECRIKKAVAFVLQPASAFNEAGIQELIEQSCSLLSGSAVTKRLFRDQIAFNLLSRMGRIGKDGYSAVEKRILVEIGRVLGGPEFPLTLSLVQAPVLHTYSIMTYVELDKKMDIPGLETLFRQNPYFTLAHQEGPNQASAATVAGKDEIFIGQIKKEESSPGGFWIWLIADNLIAGSSLNAFEIARSFFLGSRANA